MGASWGRSLIVAVLLLSLIIIQVIIYGIKIMTETTGYVRVQK